jgi:hypothetical protein
MDSNPWEMVCRRRKKEEGRRRKEGAKLAI